MKTPLLLCIKLFVFGCCLAFTASAQAPVITLVTPNSVAVNSYSKLELTITLTAGYTNPYDYDDIAVSCVFTSPSLKTYTVDGFFMQDYSLNTSTGNITPVGTGAFKVRFAPVEPGTWTYRVSCTNKTGTTQFGPLTFVCNSASSPGYVRKNATNYLNLDNGSQYIPVGEDMGWQDNNPYLDYTKWLGKLSSNGGNFIRVWMADWSFGLEWQNGNNGYQGLKKYKQSNAFYLDWLMDKCAQTGVYMMLNLNHHGQVSTGVNPEWASNPYNSALGGPCANTWDFFSNSTAKADIKNRFRYIVARYGFSTSIMSWELFNEVEWTDQFATYKSDITAWHNEMATYIKSKDVYSHLVTTSYAMDYNDANTWNLENIDFTQTHYYVSSPNLESVLAAGTQTYLSAYNKPTLNGEFGLSADGGSLGSIDPNGVYIHNAIWGSALSGAMGSAMTWWWDNYIETSNLYYHYKPLAAFVAGLKLKDDNYKQVTAVATGDGGADLTVSPGGGWAAPTSPSFTIDASGIITPGVGQLGTFLYGNVYNTQYRNPPTFTVNYSIAGQFKVSIGDIATSPQLQVYIDGTNVLSTAAAKNTVYTVNIPAGNHTIKVDNLGTDWVQVLSYVFTKIGSPLSNYVLRSAANNKAAGWVLNNQYNYQYLQSNGGTPPAAVTASTVTVPGILNGTYKITLYNCATGTATPSPDVVVTGGNLTIPLGAVTWDVAFTAVNANALPITLSKFTGETINGRNNLHINIATAANIKTISVERGAAPSSFTALGMLDITKGVTGNHLYVDASPLKDNNFYRLKVNDADGSFKYSNTLLLKNTILNASFYPNPVKANLSVSVNGLKDDDYTIVISDAGGRKLQSKSYHINASGSTATIPFAQFATGIYIVKIINKKDEIIAWQKIVK